MKFYHFLKFFRLQFVIWKLYIFSSKWKRDLIVTTIKLCSLLQSFQKSFDYLWYPTHFFVYHILKFSKMVMVDSLEQIFYSTCTWQKWLSTSLVTASVSTLLAHDTVFFLLSFTVWAINPFAVLLVLTTWKCSAATELLISSTFMEMLFESNKSNYFKYF